MLLAPAEDRFSPTAYGYYLTVPPNGNQSVTTDIIEPGIHEAKAEFGVHFVELPWGETPENTDKTPYIMVGPLAFVKEEWHGVRNPLKTGSETGDHLRRLGATDGVKLNLVTTFESRGSSYAPLLLGELANRGAFGWDIDIPYADNVIGGNSIYPDTLARIGGQTLVTVSAEDVADNIRCETFRLAYNDVRDNSPEAVKALQDARAEASDTITQLAATIRNRHLWHRAPTDGALFVATSEGWLVSQTGSNKAAIQPDRFSLIRSFDPDTNTIVSVGQNPPSSDAPEFLMALECSDDNPKLGVHFHSNGLTRISSDYEVVRHRTPSTIRYGRFSSAPAVIAALAEAGGKWTTLKEHGSFWIGESIADFNSFISARAITEAHQLGLRPAWNSSS